MTGWRGSVRLNVSDRERIEPQLSRKRLSRRGTDTSALVPRSACIGILVEGLEPDAGVVWGGGFDGGVLKILTQQCAAVCVNYVVVSFLIHDLSGGTQAVCV